MLRFAWASTILFCLASCSADPAGSAGDASMDTGVPDRRPIGDSAVECRYALPVDIVWMIDNSNSMEQEQASLAANFPALINLLTSPPDADGDGMEDWPALNDLRMAVVTSDFGVGENRVVGCDASGDRGEFISESRAADPACTDYRIPTGSWLTYGGGSSDGITTGFECIARLGTDGCGLEQQLESVRTAITDRMAGGDTNAGFFRPDSLIAVIFVTDEDDCSAMDDSFFDASPTSVAELGPLSNRCGNHPERLHPVSRYIQAFRALELDRRGDVIISAITGVPPELVRDPTSIDYEALLADESMQIRPDPEEPTRLAPACEYGGVGSAAPARRLVEVVQDFAADGHGLVQSICQTDLRPAVEAVARSIAGRLCPPPI